MYTDDEIDDAEQLRRRRRVMRAVLVVLVLLGIVWAYAIWYSTTQDSPEDFEAADREAIANACEDALDRLRALPDLDARSTALDAVALARAEHEVFGTMLRDIRMVDVDGDAATARKQWLEDWDDVLARRAEYVDRLEKTGTGEWRSPLDTILRMSEYADARGIHECSPEYLQLDVLDRPRSYEDA